MIRCFCLREKRCTFGAMCASGTLRIYNCHCEALPQHCKTVLRNDRVLRTENTLPKKSEFLDSNSLKTARI